MRLITIEYDGFHGRDEIKIRPRKVEELLSSAGKRTAIITISVGTARRINRKVGCQTHKMVFGYAYKIPNTCQCNEGLIDQNDSGYDDPIESQEISDSEEIRFFALVSNIKGIDFIVPGVYPSRTRAETDYCTL